MMNKKPVFQKLLHLLPQLPNSLNNIISFSAITFIIIIFQHHSIIVPSNCAVTDDHNDDVVLPNNNNNNINNNESVPAVLVFGDSIVDSGNNNYILTIVKSNFLPYGRDFASGNLPTGRFSNGLVPSDIIGIYIYLFIY